MRTTDGTARATTLAFLLTGAAFVLYLDSSAMNSGNSDDHGAPDLYFMDVTARNVALCESIPVCSNDRPPATTEAIGIWNHATDVYTDAPVFVF